LVPTTDPAAPPIAIRAKAYVRTDPVYPIDKMVVKIPPDTPIIPN
jgi:hypothetical protein